MHPFYPIDVDKFVLPLSACWQVPTPKSPWTVPTASRIMSKNIFPVNPSSSRALFSVIISNSKNLFFNRTMSTHVYISSSMGCWYFSSLRESSCTSLFVFLSSVSTLFFFLSRSAFIFSPIISVSTLFSLSFYAHLSSESVSTLSLFAHLSSLLRCVSALFSFSETLSAQLSSDRSLFFLLPFSLS